MPPKKRARVSKRTANSGDAGEKVGGKRKAAASESGRTEERSEPLQYCRWLMKSEPESRFENGIDVKFGIEDLKALPDQTGCWDGVRNYQRWKRTTKDLCCVGRSAAERPAYHTVTRMLSMEGRQRSTNSFSDRSAARNFMRQMKNEQLAFFYHSNCKEPGIAGVMKIVKEAYVDHTQFDKKDVHFDANSKPDNPKWSMVDVQYQRMLKRFLPLSELKKYHLQHRATGGPLKDMALFTRARLSVQPLTTGFPLQKKVPGTYYLSRGSKRAKAIPKGDVKTCRLLIGWRELSCVYEEFDFVLSLEDEEPL